MLLPFALNIFIALYAKCDTKSDARFAQRQSPRIRSEDDHASDAPGEQQLSLRLISLPATLSATKANSSVQMLRAQDEMVSALLARLRSGSGAAAAPQARGARQLRASAAIAADVDAEGGGVLPPLEAIGASSNGGAIGARSSSQLRPLGMQLAGAPGGALSMNALASLLLRQQRGGAATQLAAQAARNGGGNAAAATNFALQQHQQQQQLALQLAFQQRLQQRVQQQQQQLQQLLLQQQRQQQSDLANHQQLLNQLTAGAANNNNNGVNDPNAVALLRALGGREPPNAIQPVQPPVVQRPFANILAGSANELGPISAITNGIVAPSLARIGTGLGALSGGNVPSQSSIGPSIVQPPSRATDASANADLLSLLNGQQTSIGANPVGTEQSSLFTPTTGGQQPIVRVLSDELQQRALQQILQQEQRILDLLERDSRRSQLAQSNRRDLQTVQEQQQRILTLLNQQQQQLQANSDGASNGNRIINVNQPAAAVSGLSPQQLLLNQLAAGQQPQQQQLFLPVPAQQLFLLPSQQVQQNGARQNAPDLAPLIQTAPLTVFGLASTNQPQQQLTNAASALGQQQLLQPNNGAALSSQFSGQTGQQQQQQQLIGQFPFTTQQLLFGANNLATNFAQSPPQSGAVIGAPFGQLAPQLNPFGALQSTQQDISLGQPEPQQSPQLFGGPIAPADGEAQQQQTAQQLMNDASAVGLLQRGQPEKGIRAQAQDQKEDLLDGKEEEKQSEEKRSEEMEQSAEI